MANHQNRGRINCAPLSIRKGHNLLRALPASLEPVAYTYENFPLVPDGILVRMKSTDRLHKWVGGALQSVDQRKAAAALNWMTKRNDEGYDWHNAGKPTKSQEPHDA